MTDYSNTLIFGKNPTESIVSIEAVEDRLLLYMNDNTVREMKNFYWILAPEAYDMQYKRLKGNLHYKYIRLFPDRREYRETLQKYRKARKDFYNINDSSDAAMSIYGLTLFKGLKVSDVSVLSFDLETNGLAKNSDSKVFMISNTFRDSAGKISRKLFREDKYGSQGEMIRDWCTWVCGVNPSVLVGHNILSYDLPFLDHCLRLDTPDEGLLLGRDGSDAYFNSYPSNKRVSGSEEWGFHNCKIHGRNICDTMFLAVTYDFQRNFPSWGLKPIVSHLIKELEVKTKKKWTEIEKGYYERLTHNGVRQFYDASLIRKNWSIPEEREKIVQYGIDDSDDALILYDIMIPSLFYFTMSIPKTLQNVVNTATGSQVNSLLVRSYIQLKHSIPKADLKTEFPGAISFGKAGIYKNAIRFDVSSLYPSVILQYSIYDQDKDPEKNFLKMVEYFTDQRLLNKKLAKDTGDKYYDDLQASQKIGINSCYGLLGAVGLNFNSVTNADAVTRYGRGILQKAILWASGKKMEEIIK